MSKLHTIPRQGKPPLTDSFQIHVDVKLKASENCPPTKNLPQKKTDKFSVLYAMNDNDLLILSADIINVFFDFSCNVTFFRHF